MPKNTTINLRVDNEVKEQAKTILESLGLSLSEAFNLLLHQVRIMRGLPFEIKLRLPAELNDGYGSYICEYGYKHDYSKFDFESIERELSDPELKSYTNMDELIADFESDTDDDEI